MSGPYGYLVGPVVALLVVGVLALLLRWAFSRGGSLVERPPQAGRPDEYGLLVPVAAPYDDADGARLCALLGGHGVRAVLTPTSDGLRLMVFTDDEPAARRLLAGS